MAAFSSSSLLPRLRIQTRSFLHGGHSLQAMASGDFPLPLPPVVGLHEGGGKGGREGEGAIRGGAVVPAAPPPTERQVALLHDFVESSRRLVVLTGAGVSTESGIPDYRSPNGAYSSGFKPMTHQEFIGSPGQRRRYWARSYVGWARLLAARPGPAHVAVARLEEGGRAGGGLVTQNVDRLHTMAGSRFALELHGSTRETVCLACGNEGPREAMQDRLRALNPEWAAAAEASSLQGGGARQRPDGDAELDDLGFGSRAELEGFRVPPCDRCGGVLKPNVVFFGDNLPKERAAAANAMVTRGDALLVLGSSLAALSAFRLARAAREAGQPVALVNVGPTRADDVATLKIEARCGEVLTRLLATGSMAVPRV